MIIHNVTDRRSSWVGSWDTSPLDIARLTNEDIGRTVIYLNHGWYEAGTLTSWNSDTGMVFARYSNGDTAAGANCKDLVFGVSEKWPWSSV